MKTNNKKINYLYTLSIFLFCIFVIINLVAIYYVGPYAWDDGAITLAYGQTMGNYGKFALTNASEIVEGSSSITLVFLSAIITKIFHLDFYNFITWAQLNTFIFTIITLFLTYKTLQPVLHNKAYALIITSLMALFPMYTTEIMNGMEMTIFSSLLLLLIFAYEKKSTWIYVIVPLLLLTRFEAILYLSFTFLAIAIFDKKNRQHVLQLFSYTLLIFMLFTLVRYLYFGDFLPNTIWAKMNPPYSPTGLILTLYKKISGGIEFLYVFNFLFIGTFLFFLNKKKEICSIKLWLIVSFFVFALIAGKNWGYNGRMFLAILPVIVVFFTWQVMRVTYMKFIMDGQTKEWTFSERSKFYIIITVLVISLMVNSRLTLQNVKTVLTGGFYQNRYLPSMVHRKLESKLSNNVSFGVTPENYKVTGTAVEEVRKVLGLDTIKFMVPDVGGLGLCCERINVIDSALLTNSYLAKYGYEKFESLLQVKIPDIIESHGIWSTVTKIYEKEFFINNYVPIVIQDNFFWLNKKYISKLIQNLNLRNNKVQKVDINKIPTNLRYRGNEIDENFIESYNGDVYVVNF